MSEAKTRVHVRKETIPEPLRRQVWNDWIGILRRVGLCYCCRGQIADSDWQCGHVVSEARGGKVEAGNLRPVCGGCNRSMGSRNMNDFAVKSDLVSRWPGKPLPTLQVYRQIIKEWFREQLAKEESETKGDAKDLPDVQARAAPPVGGQSIAELCARLSPNAVSVSEQKGDALLAFLDATVAYEYNREVDEKRVELIRKFSETEFDAKDVVDWRNTMICIAIVPKRGGKEFVRLDGSHRMAALRRLKDPGKVVAILWLKRCQSTEQLSEEFHRINCGTPVPAAYYDKILADVAGRFVDMVTTEFPGHEREGKTAQRPYYKRREVVDALTENVHLRDHVVARQISIVDLKRTFDELLQKRKDEFEKFTQYQREKYPEAALAKIEAHGFYLGLDSGKVWAQQLAVAALADLDRQNQEPVAA